MKQFDSTKDYSTKIREKDFDNVLLFYFVGSYVQWQWQLGWLPHVSISSLMMSSVSTGGDICTVLGSSTSVQSPTLHRYNRFFLSFHMWSGYTRRASGAASAWWSRSSWSYWWGCTSGSIAVVPCRRYSEPTPWRMSPPARSSGMPRR